MSDDIYSKPESDLGDVTRETEVNSKPGWALSIATVLIVLINTPLSFLVGVATSRTGPSGGAGYVIGQVFLFPLLAVAVFQIWRRFRNTRSRVKIFFWCSIFVLFSIFGNIIDASSPHG